MIQYTHTGAAGNGHYPEAQLTRGSTALILPRIAGTTIRRTDMDMRPFGATLASFWRENRLAVLVGFAGIVLSLYLHLQVWSSPLTESPENWNARMNAHLTWHPFEIRYFQTYATIALAKLTGFSLKTAFYSIQYALAFVLSLLFFRFLRRLEFTRGWSTVGVALLVTSLPVVGAHFEPIHTWDDFWVYIFTLLTIWSVLDRRWPLAAFWFTLGCFAREQTLFFFPILLLAAWWDRRTVSRSTQILCLVTPIVIYGGFYALVYEPPGPDRWRYYHYSLENAARIADSVTSLINGFGFMWVAAVVGGVTFSARTRSRTENLLLWGAILSVPWTTFFAIFFTLVRETRILFPPFLFVVPLALIALKEILGGLKQGESQRYHIGFLAITVALAVLFGFAANWFWPKMDYIPSAEYRRLWAGVQIGLSVAFMIGLVHARWGNRRLVQNKAAPV